MPKWLLGPRDFRAVGKYLLSHARTNFFAAQNVRARQDLHPTRARGMADTPNSMALSIAPPNRCTHDDCA
jgi:hypothetical protein